LSQSGDSAKKKAETSKKRQLEGTSVHNAPHGHFLNRVDGVDVAVLDSGGFGGSGTELRRC
jgi:hypothetical protein